MARLGARASPVSYFFGSCRVGFAHRFIRTEITWWAKCTLQRYAPPFHTLRLHGGQSPPYNAGRRILGTENEPIDIGDRLADKHFFEREVFLALIDYAVFNVL